MLNIVVTVDYGEAFRKLDAFDRGGWARRSGDALAEEQVLPFFRYYPQPARKKQPFVSDKSRKYFFAALRDGRIAVPYRRTMALAALWDVTSTGLYTTTVRSKRKNAEYVIGDKKQAAYHKGVWKNVAEVAAFIEQNTAQSVVERVITEDIRRLGLWP